MNLGPLTVSGSYQYVLNQSGNSITLGNGNAVNWNSSNVVTRTGTQEISGIKTFKNNIIIEGDFIVDRTNGNSNITNTNGAISIGELSYQNVFGGEASSNTFGYNATYCEFGALSNSNYFGYGSSINYFGQDSTDNLFGSFNGSNSCVGTFMIQDTGRIRLANFTGSSTQTGLRGEARVSGSYLYLCTGEVSGWGRIQLSGGF